LIGGDEGLVLGTVVVDCVVSGHGVSILLPNIIFQNFSFIYDITPAAAVATSNIFNLGSESIWSYEDLLNSTSDLHSELMFASICQIRGMDVTLNRWKMR
jgi:hypothetical protein